ncbi:ion transporter [Parvularcula sp. IMCC14364]|uniref:ion transporter n=1 Tax=Parvularcula sp. IMCC14364 TaxID=3067902 RepID=UPI002741B35F|nr:ion transporter [Parvularcula sp. IMCC14364]
MTRDHHSDAAQAELALSAGQELPAHTAKLRTFLESRLFQNSILLLIVANAVTLGMETFTEIRAEYALLLYRADLIFLAIFVIELLMRIYAYRRQFFRNGWNVFDFIIISLSVLALPNAFSAFRAFRVLRVLHLVTVMPRMRVVVSALLDSIPGIFSVGVVLVLILYVFAVISANLYGPDHPDLFADVFTAMYTLFQVMTLEGWPDVASAVAETHPSSWIFFVIFVLIATFTMLNLFVAIVVRVVEEDSEDLEHVLVRENAELREELQEVHGEIVQLQETMSRMDRALALALQDLPAARADDRDKT